MTTDAKTKYPLLFGIDSPEDLRALSVETLPMVADEIRRFMIESVSKTGGHLASSLGAVELALALHYVFNTPEDPIVWDVGHQAYAHKIITGRRDAMAGLRHYGGISGFPKRSESPYDSFGTAHSSTSISAALGMAVADHLAGKNDRWHIAVIGDGALTGGMAVEALNHAGIYKDGVKLLIILNDNNCSISPAVGALSGNLGKLVATGPVWKARDLSKRALKGWPGLWELAKRMEKQTVNFLSPPSSLFSTFDLNYFGPIDGHDVVELVKLLTNLRKLDGPIVLHVKTLKGKGYAPAEADPTTYHGVSPFDPKVGIEKKPADPSHPTYTQVFSKWVCDMGEADPQLYAITPAMREGSGLVEFEKRFPERYRDVAIAEQHAVTYAAGLACAGMHPVVAIYSSFAQRAYDQILHDVAIQNLGVTFAIDRGGIVGADGATHHGVFDLAFLRSIPNMTVMAPSDEAETRQMLRTAVKLGTPAAVRYPRGGEDGYDGDCGDEPVTVLRQGTDAAIVTYGILTGQALRAAELLEKEGVSLRVVKLNRVAPLDGDGICRALDGVKRVVAAEDQLRAGAVGERLGALLLERGAGIERYALRNAGEALPAQGSTAQLRHVLGLDAEGMAQAVREVLK